MIGEDGEKYIYVWAVREPRLPTPRAPDTAAERVRPEDVIMFKVDYNLPAEDEWGNRPKTPNAEGLVVATDGSKLWIIEKTYQNDGEGPAGVWERCVRRRGEGGAGAPAARLKSRSERARC